MICTQLILYNLGVKLLFHMDPHIYHIYIRLQNVSNILRILFIQVRAPQGAEPKVKAFDAEHERRRKLQLTKLFDRSQEMVNLVISLRQYLSFTSV